MLMYQGEDCSNASSWVAKRGVMVWSPRLVKSTTRVFFSALADDHGKLKLEGDPRPWRCDDDATADSTNIELMVTATVVLQEACRLRSPNLGFRRTTVRIMGKDQYTSS